MKSRPGRTRRFAGALMVLAAVCPRVAACAETARLGVKVLPFSGVVVPHQQLARFDPSLPLGVGLEVHYTPVLSLSVDIQKSRHPFAGDEDLELSSLQFLGRWRWVGFPLVPFAQAGVGGFQAVLERDGDDGSFGGAGAVLGGGAEIEVWPAVFLQADLRSNWVWAKDTKTHDNIWAGHTQVLLWAVYKLP